MNIRKTYPFNASLLVLLSALASGCKSGPKTQAPLPNARLEIQGAATPSINLDPDGHPLSVVVRLYQLKDRADFSRLTFDVASASQSDTEALPSDALGHSEWVLIPGGTLRTAEDLRPGTRYLGLVGLFRNPDPQFWRYLVSLDQVRPAPVSRFWTFKSSRPAPCSLRFAIQGSSLVLRDIQPEPIPGQPGRNPAMPETRTEKRP
jgi:type VI secretion system protein VasD